MLKDEPFLILSKSTAAPPPAAIAATTPVKAAAPAGDGELSAAGTPERPTTSDEQVWHPSKPTSQADFHCSQ